MEGIKQIEQQLREAAEVLNTFVSNPHNLEQVEKAAQLMAQSLEQGGKLLSCGNGGSHCDAMHFAEELTGKYREERKPLAAIAISDPSFISCTGNDYGYEHIFSRFVQGVGRSGDVLLAISTSGNSANVLKAAEAARKSGISVVALTGKNGGKLADLADVEIRVAHNGYADRIQEIHIKVIHIIIQRIEQILGVG
ncbi:D-sedoheptulose 7-phosphate isomerase [Cesiribacter sp. SM1]|uniref:D-sedoheptulose 7-phosphate isomerase n=1 Tax=Cesiribacter sp. SM1 TaxID=2861196 RepID=UPI001CD6C47F|nr:D-sedoheptulose 7-phosphate isomerase [Cesiribacter sp. SM1]